MRQLSMFTRAEIAGMRDRTASRTYSPAGDDFRREHERHRAWGLKRRHAECLRRSRNTSGGGTGRTPTPICRPQPTHAGDRSAQPKSPTQQASCGQPTGDVRPEAARGGRHLGRGAGRLGLPAGRRRPRAAKQGGDCDREPPRPWWLIIRVQSPVQGQRATSAASERRELSPPRQNDCEKGLFRASGLPP